MSEPTTAYQLLANYLRHDLTKTPEAGDGFVALLDEVVQEARIPPNHPDDGHGHHFTCIRCGVNPPEQEARANADRELTYTEEMSAVFRILGNHEGMGCCDPKTLEHVAQSIREALAASERKS